MGKISWNQNDYIKAYEKLKEKGINPSGIVMIAETSYDEKVRLVEYKFDLTKKANNYEDKIDSWYKSMIRVFYKVDDESPIYQNFREIFRKVFLDNKDDDTNDYRDETMLKLNKIYSFIDDVNGQDLKGTELLSLIRKNITDERVDEPLEDITFDNMFEELKNKSEAISFSKSEQRIEMISDLLNGISKMETHLFREKLFYDDYRKSVIGLANYLLSKANVPEIYIKPIDLDEYYSYVNDGDDLQIVTFYKEKICDSLNDAFVVPMKLTIKHVVDESYKYESGETKNKIVDLRQNKYK